MEERLLQFKPKAPAANLRSRVLTAAMRQRTSVWERLWASRLFWCSSCAALAGCLLLAGPWRPQWPAAYAPAQAQEHDRLARSLAEMAGGGPELERWLALRLSGRIGHAGAGGTSRSMLLEELKWPG